MDTSYSQRSRNELLLSKPYSPLVRNKLNYQHEDSIDGQLHIDSVDNIKFDSHQNNINDDNDCDRSSEEQCDIDAYLKFLDRRYHLLHQRQKDPQTSDSIDIAPLEVGASTVKVGKGNIVLPYMRQISAGTSVIRRINYSSTLQFFSKVCMVLLNKVVGFFHNVRKNSKLFSLFGLVVLSF